jgi:predicted ester cyclase
MATEANKALLRKIYEAVNEANFTALEAHPGFWETRQVVPPMHRLFADWRTMHVQQIAEDSKVFSYGVIQMTHVGPFASVGPTNKRITFEGFFLDQIADGRVVEHNGTTTWPDVIRQLGTPAFQALAVRAPHVLTQNAQAHRHDAETLASNKAAVARLLQALSRGDASDVSQHGDVGALYEEFAAIRHSFPDLHYTLVMQVAEGDLLGTRATLRGTHKSAFFGFAPTGKTIAWDFFSFARVVDGAVVEHNGSADWTAALIHLGLLAP